MREAAEWLAATVAVTSGLAGAWAAWCWWRVEDRRSAWRALRAAQGVAVAQAAGAGVLVLGGFDPDGLFWLYALLPVAVMFIAEQLRIASAETVLESRGLPDARAVGALEPRAQRSVVVAILRRELGVLAVSALVVAFLALRAMAAV